MKVKINDKWMVISNNYCFTLVHTKVKGVKSKYAGEKVYEHVGHYHDLSSLFKDLIVHDIRRSDCTTFAEVLQRVDGLKKLIEEVVQF